MVMGKLSMSFNANFFTITEEKKLSSIKLILNLIIL